MFFFIKCINYFVIGSFLGLLSWLLSLFHYGGSELEWMLWMLIPFGAFVMGVISITEQIYDGEQGFFKKIGIFVQEFQWFFIGLMLGAIGALVGVFAGRMVFYTLIEQTQAVLFARVCGMFILGILLGAIGGLVELFRMHSRERYFSIVLAGALGGALGGFLRHVLTLFSGKMDFLGLTIVLFGGILVMAIVVVTRLRTSAKLTGHPDNVGVKYGEGFEYALPSDSDLWIGSGMRERNSPKTRLKIYADAKVDKIQAAIGQKEDGWYLIQAPEFPRQGQHTYINGKQIKGRTRIRNGDVLTFGRTKFRFVETTEEINTTFMNQMVERSGRTLKSILFCLPAFLGICSVPSVNAEVLIQPDKHIETTGYPYFKVPFHLIDSETGEVIKYDVQAKEDPAKWSVHDIDGNSLGEVISVEPLDTEKHEDKLYVILTIDLSKSMDKPRSNPKLAQALRVATKFVSGLKPNCYVAVLPFAAMVQQIDTLEFLGPEYRDELRKQIADLKNYPVAHRYCTALYPALTRSIKRLQQIDPQYYRAVILFTDGYEDLEDSGRGFDCNSYKHFYTEDELDENALKSLVKEAQIPIYAIGFNLPEEREKELALRQLTIDSNTRDENRFFKDSGESLGLIYQRMHNVTQAKKFLLTFKTHLSRNQFIDPPKVYISKAGVTSQPAQITTGFFSLPAGDAEEQLRNWGKTTLVICMVLFALIGLQAFLRIQMLSRVKALEEKQRAIPKKAKVLGLPSRPIQQPKHRRGRSVSEKELQRMAEQRKKKTEARQDMHGKNAPQQSPLKEKGLPDYDRFNNVPSAPQSSAPPLPQLDDAPDWLGDDE